ncbi:hypothetical protein, partial [Jiella flava]|uniref:hypothetical protein n=1 Tax=Jiella flava TaxID=2816857 RepID=UPI003F72F7DE
DGATSNRAAIARRDPPASMPRTIRSRKSAETAFPMAHLQHHRIRLQQKTEPLDSDFTPDALDQSGAVSGRGRDADAGLYGQSATTSRFCRSHRASVSILPRHPGLEKPTSQVFDHSSHNLAHITP